ncbi:Amidohydrolase [Candidatus Izimaplasma bacterium HR1]|jgi:predicted TIM-barrel fold metal-dependent hydrolase|uniref:amidohydrolase family protein n=1 Tax=Candidatus Izimoplasma sp. HR1 TaxID=1541959 RepID=UPI0004F6C02C|nr:Amidohydrolase [Candidatus Izimaplasma bacterium HR1]
MKIIDAHIHFSNIKSFKEICSKSRVDYSLEGFNNEFEDYIAIGMGVTENKGIFPDDTSINPMTLDLDVNPNNLYTCLGFNPNQDINIDEFEKQITEKVVGLKIYAGYYHYHVHDNVYKPLLDIARKHNLPVVIHSGDTFSQKGLLKYSHPLEVDELAVMNPDINFMIAHFGDPWIMTAAEVAAKNANVYIDLSGLIVGDFHQVERFRKQEFVSHITRGLVYLDNYKKILYGSDWPLVDTRSYIKFIKELIPKEHQEDVFYNNAKNLFKI